MKPANSSGWERFATSPNSLNGPHAAADLRTSSVMMGSPMLAGLVGLDCLAITAAACRTRCSAPARGASAHPLVAHAFRFSR